MSNKKLFKSSIVASAIVVTAGFNATATPLFNYSNLGSGQAGRASLLEKSGSNKTIELKCGVDSAKGKDAKCGKDSTKTKKGKDGKCGEGKCGSSKKS